MFYANVNWHKVGGSHVKQNDIARSQFVQHKTKQFCSLLFDIFWTSQPISFINCGLRCVFTPRRTNRITLSRRHHCLHPIRVKLNRNPALPSRFSVHGVRWRSTVWGRRWWWLLSYTADQANYPCSGSYQDSRVAYDTGFARLLESLGIVFSWKLFLLDL